MQLIRLGTILNSTNRDANEFVLKDGLYEIITTDRRNKETGRILIDKEDYKQVKGHKWHLHHSGYAYSKIESKSISLHRFILRPQKHQVVDHINHNRLDNRKSNLRICLKAENCRNRKNAVGISPEKGKWRAQIGFNYKRIYLGLYPSLEEALSVRREAEVEFFKEYAPIHHGVAVFGRAK